MWWEMVLKDQTGTPAVRITTGLFLHLLVGRARHFFFFLRESVSERKKKKERESVSGVHSDISKSV